MKNTKEVIRRFPQWCNLIIAPRFCATKVCLQASEISKICLFGHPTGQATSPKASFKICFTITHKKSDTDLILFI